MERNIKKNLTKRQTSIGWVSVGLSGLGKTVHTMVFTRTETNRIPTPPKNQEPNKPKMLNRSSVWSSIRVTLSSTNVSLYEGYKLAKPNLISARFDLQEFGGCSKQPEPSWLVLVNKPKLCLARWLDLWLNELRTHTSSTRSQPSLSLGVVFTNLSSAFRARLMLYLLNNLTFLIDFICFKKH